jgi:hypothetical protein
MSVPEMLFGADYFEPSQVDEQYTREAAIAEQTGFKVRRIDCTAIDDEREDNWVAATVRWIPRSAGGGTRPAVYRGWMYRANDYRSLYEALLARGCRLINSPQQYIHCHHLPENYPLIASRTAKTIWLPGDPDHGTIMAALAVFGGNPIILKDYVKSEKHRWREACFIPSSSDDGEVRRVVEFFRACQGDNIQNGLVFREFLDLTPVDTHHDSGMPLSLEYRVVVLDGNPVAVFPYWGGADYPPGAELPPLDEFAGIFLSINSRFFTADLARMRDGRWVIIELGDAQVAELPDDVLECVHRVLVSTLTGGNYA